MYNCNHGLIYSNHGKIRHALSFKNVYKHKQKTMTKHKCDMINTGVSSDQKRA